MARRQTTNEPDPYDEEKQTALMSKARKLRPKLIAGITQFLDTFVYSDPVVLQILLVLSVRDSKGQVPPHFVKADIESQLFKHLLMSQSNQLIETMLRAVHDVLATARGETVFTEDGIVRTPAAMQHLVDCEKAMMNRCLKDFPKTLLCDLPPLN